MLSAKLFHSNLIASPRMIRVTIDYQLSPYTKRRPDSTSKGEHVWSYNWIWICDRQKSTFDSLACEISHQDLLSSLVASQFVFVFFLLMEIDFQVSVNNKKIFYFRMQNPKVLQLKYVNLHDNRQLSIHFSVNAIYSCKISYGKSRHCCATGWVGGVASFNVNLSELDIWKENLLNSTQRVYQASVINETVEWHTAYVHQFSFFIRAASWNVVKV